MSQQSHYYYGQGYQYPPSVPTPGPSQQHPIRSSWRDPRFASPSPEPPAQAGYQAPAHGYTYQPSNYGPMPGSVASPVSPIQQPALPSIPHYVRDTTTWGVRYNHGPQQYITEGDQPPALPPRPSTTPLPEEHAPPQADYHQSNWQYQQHPVSTPPPPLDYNHLGSTTPLPPPPPPPPPPPLPPSSHQAFTTPQPHAQESSQTSVLDYAQDSHGYAARPTSQTPSSATPGTWNAPSQAAGYPGNLPSPPPPPPPPRPSQYQPQWYEHQSHSIGPHLHEQGYHPGTALLPDSRSQGVGNNTSSQSPPPIADYNLSTVGCPQGVPMQPPDEVRTGQQRDGARPPDGIIDLGAFPQTALEMDKTDEQEVARASKHESALTTSLPGKDQVLAENQSEKHSPEPEFAGIQRTGTIDSVIQAWTKPIEPGQQVTQSTPWNDPGFAPALRQLSLLARHPDPFQDLSPEARASLERFATTLRKETEAETDEEKFQTFNAFVHKELRLRAVLYGHDISKIGNDRLKGTGVSDTVIESDSLSEKIPVDTVANSETKEIARELGCQPNGGSPEEDAGPPERQDSEKEVVARGSSSSRPAFDRSWSDKEVVLQKHQVQIGAAPGFPKQATPPPSRPNKRPSSPGADAPIVVEPNDLIAHPPPHHPTEESAISISRPASRSERPYTPFTYQPVDKPRSTQPADKRSSAESYAALRQANVNSGRAMGPSIVPPSLSMNQSYPRMVAKEEQAEAFLGLLREQTRSDGSRTPSPSAVLSAANPQRHASDAQDRLRALIPAELPQYSESSALSTIRRSLRSIPDDFSFIKGRVLEWSRANLEEKKRLDAERRRRNEASEKHIDALFNENEIGYSEIAPLEKEHRAEEEKILAKEEMDEADSFTVHVFTYVTERLQSDLNSLAQVYADAMTLVESHSASGSEFVKDSSTKTALPQAMDTLLVVFSKMQIRHQKLLEASLEHSRRARKATVSSLRATGEILQAQEYEISSLKAEQDMIIDTKEKDDDRANFLLDTFDKVTVNGLSQNQAYIDDLLILLRDVEEMVSKDSGYDMPSLRCLLLSAQSVLDFVAADSVSILGFSSTSDTILNNADYDVCVAKAYRNDASAEEFRLLEEEKRKEDKKIYDETTAKQDSMVKGSREIQKLVADLLNRTEESQGHRQRIETALERAKQRNASLSSAGPVP